MAHSTFRLVDPAVLDADPFWAVVRQRHPGLDVILLPGDPPGSPEPARPTQPLAEIRAAASRLLAGWRLLQPLVASIDVLDPDRRPSVRWEERGDDAALVIQRAVIGVGQEAGGALLGACAIALGQERWLLRPGKRDGLPTMEAVEGADRYDGIAGPGATVLTLTGPALRVAPADRETVSAEIREEVSR